jgi:hypothetical protein
MEAAQLILSLAILGMLFLVYREVRSLDPAIKSIGKTADSANKITSFLGL